MSDYLIAVIVGCVEGLTEFIPVSSTAHMIIVGHMLGFKGPFAALFDVFIQLGAILSIIFIYKERFHRFLTRDGWDVKKGLSVWHIALGMLPVCLVGFAAHGYIKTYLFSPFTAAFGLVLGALLMIYAEKKMGPRDASLVQDIDKVSLKQCFIIGLYQLLSLWPGFSRSGSTMAGGMLAGVGRNVAAQYTFLMAVPLMFIACIFDLLKNLDQLGNGGAVELTIGFVTAFVTAYISVLWFLKFLKNSTLTAFSIYRIILAAVVLLYFL
ncbi:MAG: Undecaprenyl-diphosphatase [Succiniclasticum sp.]|jgi:undecaprenyl-diphosphatase